MVVCLKVTFGCFARLSKRLYVVCVGRHGGGTRVGRFAFLPSRSKATQVTVIDGVVLLVGFLVLGFFLLRFLLLSTYKERSKKKQEEEEEERKKG